MSKFSLCSRRVIIYANLSSPIIPRGLGGGGGVFFFFFLFFLFFFVFVVVLVLL